MNEQQQLQEIRDLLTSDEFKTWTFEDADWHLRPTHDLAVMVLKLLLGKIQARDDKMRALGAERSKMIEERSSLLSYIWDTHGERAQLLEASGVGGWVSLTIGIMENLRDQLDSLTRDKSDPMRPEARRNVTMNDLRTTLLGMLLSGCDVALKDLDAYLECYVQAVNSIVRRSVDLERSEECHYCEQYGIGRCRQHAPQARSRR